MSEGRDRANSGDHYNPRQGSQNTLNFMSRFRALDIIKSDVNRTSAASDLSARYRGPRDKRYIFIAFLAAIFLAMSQTIRGVASYDIFSTKFALSLIYLICSMLYFAFQKIRAKRKNEVFYAPWYTAQLGTFKSMRILLTGT